MPLRDDFQRLASLADVALVHAADVVLEVSRVASAAIGLSDQVPTLIGDSFGDDLIRGYLTREQKAHVRSAALRAWAHDLGDRRPHRRCRR